MQPSEADQQQLEAYIAKCEDGLRHQVLGDSGPFLEVWSRREDVAILGAIGSYAQGFEDVRMHLLAAASALNWTKVSIRRLQTTLSADLAVTVTLEHMSRQENEQTEARTLRVTHAYRREPDGWRLILRHANQVTPADESRERDILGHS